ncbi:MAG: hypothetical protein EAZ77_11570 [Nostocales cyanobacterium]|nr:MAG: hypothetical protein EAZ77_11570 [Nostocales cyanobacterium]
MTTFFENESAKVKVAELNEICGTIMHYGFGGISSCGAKIDIDRDSKSYGYIRGYTIQQNGETKTFTLEDAERFLKDVWKNATDKDWDS